VDRAGVFRPRAEEEPIEPVEQQADVSAASEPPAAEPPPMRREPRRREPVAPHPEAAAAPIPLPGAAPPPALPAAIPTGSADPSELWSTITQILKERTGVGRPRLRATNLKDYLLARIPGFSESRYGFARFLDLLAAAERAGVLTSTDVGQVQWISLSEGEVPPGAAPAQPAPASTPAEA